MVIDGNIFKPIDKRLKREGLTLVLLGWVAQ